MKLASVRDGDAVRGVVVDGDTVFALPDGLSVGEVVAGGLDRALETGRTALRGPGVPLASVTLTLPYRPPSIREFVTFESHVEGVRKSVDGKEGVPEAWYDNPHFYFTNPHALYGPGEPIRAPRSSRALDFELEVGAVLGRTGSDLTEAEAKDAIFGYTIVNDWSARDLQAREMTIGLGPAKGKDFATSFGPWIVTADELEPFHDAGGFLDLDCRAYVNDELIGHDRLNNMHWTFAQMVAYASRDSVVLAGDLLASGTTGGGGCLAELWGRRGEPVPAPVGAGDRVVMGVEGLGELGVRVLSSAGDKRTRFWPDNRRC